jgi:hydrogenase maturation protein HypF
MPPELVRHRLAVHGIVQGVGFRPFVYSLARELGLSGFVRNHSNGVHIEIEGLARPVSQFELDLASRRPPLAVIDSVIAESIPPTREEGFVIVASEAAREQSTPVSPDVSICDDCLRELLDPADRRYCYPFINCTNCGPRFTIIRDLPYDRPATTMAPFRMCPQCEAEYRDPANRRFHAQPNACPVCGPQVSFLCALPGGSFEEHASSTAAQAIRDARAMLSAGATVAIKGIGGFHLACDAANTAAVAELRRRKARFEQPFALMMRSLELVRSFAHVSEEEERLLCSRARPIVLLRARRPTDISPLVAPGNEYLGVMLPYAPLHYVILNDPLLRDTPLVMTSANPSGTPIVRDNAEARLRLSGIADALLIHNRDIEVVCDDSVVRTFEDKLIPIRRSRGYAPMPVNLPREAEGIVAVGGELKATFCVTKGHFAYLSQHIGDMGTLETQEAFERALDHMLRLFRIEPRLVVCDLHPGYLSSRWAAVFAKALGVPLLAVQHHHAHIAALSMEAALPPEQRVIGVSFDGTGYGTDGAIWGGEVLIANQTSFERFAHLRYVPIPGGDASIRHPARTTLAHLFASGIDWSETLAPVREFSVRERVILARQLSQRLNCVDSSSMGRLFDAVASLLSVRQQVTYEGQAAIELEALAERGVAREAIYAFDFQVGAPVVMDPSPVLRAVIADLDRCVSREVIAARFHIAVARMIARICKLAHDETGLSTVALSGGVFQNLLLLREATHLLRDAGMEVLWHRVVPANDAGLALGQVAIGLGARRR